MITLSPKDRLIVPLDVPHYEDAEQLYQLLSPEVHWFKVGYEMFYASGRSITDMLTRNNTQFFLDLKLHDIPNTVGKGMEQLVETGMSMVTVHTSGGKAMMMAAREAAEKRSTELGIPRPLLLGVTVLTSLSEEDLQADGFALSVAEIVRRRSVLAMESGLDGIVCSPAEASLVKEATGGKLFTVTPGIRPQAAGDDQQRVATPFAAIQSGSDYLVVGRPIYAAVDPLAAAQAVLKEIKEALS